MEQTYIMIKPDGVQRGLIPEILKRFTQKGFTLRGLKMMNVSKSHAETHYSDLSSKYAIARREWHGALQYFFVIVLV